MCIDNVLAAALRCFAARGYVGASIRDIAHEAGLSVPGVYYHYSSKEDMLAAITTEASNEARWRVEAAHDEANDPVGRFRLMIEALCMFYLCRRDLASVAITEMRHLSPERYRRIAPIRWTVRTKIDGEIAAAAAAGLFRTSNPEEAGRSDHAEFSSCAPLLSPGGAGCCLGGSAVQELRLGARRVRPD